MERERVEKERERQEEQRRKRKEEAQRVKRILEAAFDGDTQEIKAVLKEVVMIHALPVMPQPIHIYTLHRRLPSMLMEGKQWW